MNTERPNLSLEQDLELKAIKAAYENGETLAVLLDRLAAIGIYGAFDSMDEAAWPNTFTGFDYTNQIWITI